MWQTAEEDKRWPRNWLHVKTVCLYLILSELMHDGRSGYCGYLLLPGLQYYCILPAVKYTGEFRSTQHLVWTLISILEVNSGHHGDLWANGPSSCQCVCVSVSWHLVQLLFQSKSRAASYRKFMRRGTSREHYWDTNTHSQTHNKWILSRADADRHTCTHVYTHMHTQLPHVRV